MMTGKMTDEQKNWFNKQMGSNKVIHNGNNDKKPDDFCFKYSSQGDGILRECVLIARVPYYIKKSFLEKKNEYVITVDPHIEETEKILKPPFKGSAFNPYEFATAEEPNQYLQRALKETPDTLLAKIKTQVKRFNDINDKTANLLSLTIFNSYFQDRFSTVYYLMVVGANGSGKSAFGDTFECLAYRAVKATNTTNAFFFRVFGNNEFGQVTIIAEEFDKMDEKSELMSVLKEGYQPNVKVPRMTNDNSKMEFFFPFSFKIIIAEKSPNENKARGVLDRTFKIKTYKGIPDYKIKEIKNPQGNELRQDKLNEIEDLRKLLLAYRLAHFKDPYKEITIGIDGRDEELAKPTIQLFYSLGASEETIKTIESTFQYFLDIKNKRKGETLEARIYPTLVNMVSKQEKYIQLGEDSRKVVSISASDVWASIIEQLDGKLDDKNPSLYYSDDFGKVFRGTVIKMIEDKFGAEIDHRHKGNNLIFDPDYLTKTGKIYENMGIIKTRPLSGDSVIPESPTERKTPLSSTSEVNISSVNESIGVPSSQLDIIESPNHHNNNKVKCQYCDYEEDPFFLKIHRKNAHEGGFI